MSETRDSASDRSRAAKGDLDGERSFASSVVLVGGIAAVLLAAAFLRSEPRRTTAEEVAAPPATHAAAPPGLPSSTRRAPALPSPPADLSSDLPATGAWGPASPSPTPSLAGAPASRPSAPSETLEASAGAAEPRAAALVERATRDARRLAGKRDRFTAQLVIACQPDGVERILKKGGSSPSLYVLPATVNGKSCFRVVWGTYVSRKEAVRAADLPSALRGSEVPSPKAIGEVLP